MKSLAELIELYREQERYFASERDRINEADLEDEHSYLTEADRTRMADEREEWRQIVRDTASWLETIAKRQAESNGKALATGWTWMPYPGEGDQPLYDVLVVGRVQRFYDDAPTYGEALGKRLGAISTDLAAREKVEKRIVAALSAKE